MDHSKAHDVVDEMLSHLKASFVDTESSSQVANFYANRSVFITGATGFIGKALVEKLIRTCKDVKRIYLLIREKRGKDVKERLVDFIEAPIFNRIKSQPSGGKLLEEKLRAIKGDITLAKFGISPEDMSMLSDEISIVFNSAATIRFVEPIDVAVRNNIYSVSQLVEFCNGLGSLQALIHLSTAYSNCHKRDTIYEIFYEPPMRGSEIIEAVGALKKVQNNIHIYPASRSPADTLMNASAALRQATVREVNETSSGRLEATGGLKDSIMKETARRSSESANLALSAEECDEAELPRSACEPQRFYEPNRDAASHTSKGLNASADLLDEFTQIALRRSNRPNTYTFTKAISESYLLDLVKGRPDRYLNEKIPVCIVRPSIVGGAWQEPEVGYVDNYNGPTGAVLSLYTGALQSMPGVGERVADLVPCDMVVNFLLCVGFFLVGEHGREQQQQQRGEILSRTQQNSKLGSNGQSLGNGQQRKVKRDHGAYVFNFVSGYRNPLRWHIFTDTIYQLAYKYPTKFLVRLPGAHFLRAGKLYDLYDLLNHKLPAVLQDFFRAHLQRQELTSRSSALVAYGRIRAMTETLTPFTSNQWRLSDANVCALYEHLTPTDRQLFEFDVSKIDWAKYIRNYVIGARVYTLKDEAHNVPRALRSLRKRQWVYRVSLMMLALLFYYFFVHQSALECALVQGSLGQLLGY